MKITIYTKPFCPYCARAKGVLERRGLQYTSINGAGWPLVEDEVRLRRGDHYANKITWPQVFIGDTYIGGSDDLAAWNADGRLDTLLAS